MKRLIPILATATTFFVAACGNAATAGTAATSPSPGARAGAANRGGAAGQLVQINPQMLIITGPSGDTTISYTAATTVSRTSNGGLADIAVGTCVVATGRKDANGAITATSVRVSPKPTGGCAAPAGGPGFGPGASPRPSFSPRPSSTPRPSGFANLSIVAGEVTAVSGSAVTVLSATGATGTTGTTSQTISVPSAATVTKTGTASLSDLQTGQCLTAVGPKDSSGNVQASSLVISPAGPSGTCNTRVGRGGGGGFGGFGGGGGSGAPGGVAPTGA